MSYCFVPISSEKGVFFETPGMISTKLRGKSKENCTCHAHKNHRETNDDVLSCKATILIWGCQRGSRRMGRNASLLGVLGLGVASRLGVGMLPRFTGSDVLTIGECMYVFGFLFIVNIHFRS